MASPRASQQAAQDYATSQNPGLEPVVCQAASSKPLDPCVLYRRSVGERSGFGMLYGDVRSTA